MSKEGKGPEKVLYELREDLIGKIVVGRYTTEKSEDNMQYLLDPETGKTRIFNSIEEAKKLLIDDGYSKETIDQYQYMEAAETYAKNNNFEEDF